MSELAYFSNPQRAQEQASGWIARMDAGLTDPQKLELQSWLSANSSHAEALIKMAALWDDMAIMEELSTLFPLPRSRSSASPLRWTGKVVVACCAVSLLVTAIVWLTGSVFDETPNTEVALNQYTGHYETGVGEQSTAVLPDGSTITLNTNSSLDVLYSRTERKLVMNRGEMLFEVMKDSSRPFNVHAAGHIVQAVGTAFDVRLKARQVEVTVTKGVVKVMFAPMPTDHSGRPAVVKAQPAEAVLHVGESAAFSPNQFSVDTIRQLDQRDMEIQLSWKDGMLVFENEPLSDVLDEVSRYTPIKLIAGADIRNVKVGGYFKAGDIDGLLVALKKNFDIDAERISGNQIALSRR